MANMKNKSEGKKIDTKELEFPETLFVRDIENRVFQGIILQCLARVEGIALVEGNFIDNFFSRGALDGIKGIYAEQDSKSPSVKIKIEVNIHYGYSIPEKAEEIQNLCREEITRLTGLHVSNVHIIFQNIILEDYKKDELLSEGTFSGPGIKRKTAIEDEYNDEF